MIHTTINYPYIVLNTDDQVIHWVHEILHQGVQNFFWDTEFERGGHYWPQLALIQLKYVYPLEIFHYVIIDPVDLTKESIDALSKLWRNPDMVHIFFSARQDLQTFFYWYACHMQKSDNVESFFVHNIIDLQLVLFSMNPEQCVIEAYETAVKQYLNIELSNLEQSRSPWLQRPLLEIQLHYALQDVEFLPQLYEIYKEKAKNITPQLSKWLHQEEMTLWSLGGFDSLNPMNRQTFYRKKYASMDKFIYPKRVLLDAGTSLTTTQHIDNNPVLLWYQERLAQVKNKPVRYCFIAKKLIRFFDFFKKTLLEKAAKKAAEKEKLKKEQDDKKDAEMKVGVDPKKQIKNQWSQSAQAKTDEEVKLVIPSKKQLKNQLSHNAHVNVTEKLWEMHDKNDNFVSDIQVLLTACPALHIFPFADDVYKNTERDDLKKQWILYRKNFITQNVLKKVQVHASHPLFQKMLLLAQKYAQEYGLSILWLFPMKKIHRLCWFDDENIYEDFFFGWREALLCQLMFEDKVEE